MPNATSQITPPDAPALPEFLTQSEAAELLRLKPRTLEVYRRHGKGPAYRKLGPRRVLYSRTELIEWVDSCKVSGKEAQEKEM
jgi:predicted DNA-binding transcriptional regulator AlpA